MANKSDSSVPQQISDEQRKSMLKLLNLTMLELMLLDYDNVNSPELSRWIGEEILFRREAL
jgi:hypothetical protein